MPRAHWRFGLLGIAIFTMGYEPLAAQEKTDWTQFRGPTSMGKFTGPALPVTWSAKDNIAWKIPMPGAGGSSPIIVGDKIFLTAFSGFAVPGQSGGSMDKLTRHVLCLNRADGKTIWNKEVAPKLPEQASIRESHGYASSTPVADNERVYVFFGKSGVFAFDFNGKQVWQADVGANLNGWGSATSPVLHGDLLYVNASIESESLVALDRKTGKEKWRAKGIKESWNMPLLVTLPGGKTELVVAIMGKILGFDPQTGTQLWSCNTDIGWYMVPSLVAEDGVIYCIGGRTGGALAVRAGGKGDVTKSHRIWTGTKGSNVSSPVLHKGHLYWMHEALGIAYCADLKTGAIVYEQRIPGAGQVYAAALLADEKIYYLARNGKTYVVAAKPTYELLATNDLGERSVFNSSPSAAGGRIYIRSDATLYCIGKK